MRAFVCAYLKSLALVGLVLGVPLLALQIPGAKEGLQRGIDGLHAAEAYSPWGFWVAAVFGLALMVSLVDGKGVGGDDPAGDR